MTREEAVGVIEIAIAEVEWEYPRDYAVAFEAAYGRKCRRSEAKVLAIENEDGTAANVQEVYSRCDMSFVYRVGETVKVDNFDDDRRNECAAGIHFFITRQEAVDY